MSVLVKISAAAPTPLMHERVAAAFEKLRDFVFAGSGVDFLAKCGDVSRPAGFVSSKDGVANRSWHKTGRALDYDQTSKALVIAPEPRNGKQYFRTFLICAKQDGSLGVKQTVRDYRGGSYSGYLFDFTRAAESFEFARIPAWNGWQNHYNRREFWHYEMRDGLTWDAAMLQLKGKERPAAERVIGLSDRGDDVRQVQAALHGLNLLPKAEIDGIFGAATKAALELFQRRHRLDPDGLVGPNTRKALGLK